MDLHYSQTIYLFYKLPLRFTTLWIYTILKLYIRECSSTYRFTTLWIYTILKRRFLLPSSSISFTTLWIYTILKLHTKQ